MPFTVGFSPTARFDTRALTCISSITIVAPPSLQIAPPSLPYRTPPPKIVAANVEPPHFAKLTNPITPRIQKWLGRPLATLHGHFDMGWTRYQFAMQRQGQVALWHVENRLSRSHFLDRSLESARLVMAATVPRQLRLHVPHSPAAQSPFPYGQLTVLALMAHG